MNTFASIFLILDCLLWKTFIVKQLVPYTSSQTCRCSILDGSKGASLCTLTFDIYWQITEIYWNLLKVTEIYWNLLKFIVIGYLANHDKDDVMVCHVF